MIAGRFDHIGLCQLHTKLKRLEADLSEMLNTDEWLRIDQLCKSAVDCIYNDTNQEVQQP